MDPGAAGQRAGGSSAARKGGFGGVIPFAATAGSRAATARSAGATERSRSVRHPRSRRARSPDSPRRTACSSVRLSRPRRELHSIHPPSPRSAPLRSGTFSVLESGTFSLPIDTRPGRRALAGGRGAGRGSGSVSPANRSRGSGSPRGHRAGPVRLPQPRRELRPIPPPFPGPPRSGAGPLRCRKMEHFRCRSTGCRSTLTPECVRNSIPLFPPTPAPRSALLPDGRYVVR